MEVAKEVNELLKNLKEIGKEIPDFPTCTSKLGVIGIIGAGAAMGWVQKVSRQAERSKRSITRYCH